MNPRAHDLLVLDVVPETVEATSIVLDVPPGLADRFGYCCGQFLTVRIPSATVGSVARCYSLSSSPHRDDLLTITVKRTVGGYGSNWLCDNAVVGAPLTVLEPSGTFVPRSLDRDVLLCAGGSGVTPIISIAKSILAAGTGSVVLLYANRDRQSVIFARQLDELAATFGDRLTVLHWLADERGLPTTAGLIEMIDRYPFDDVYLCGPTAFMATTRSAVSALGIAPERVAQEDYRSLADNPFEQAHRPPVAPRSDGDPTLEVEIDGERHTFTWPRNRKLLDVLLDNGIDAPYVCRESACGTCVCSVRKGRTRMVMNESLIDEELEMGLTLACQTLPETDEVSIAFDQ